MRILQVLSSLNIGSGIANSIFNYYKSIDKKQCQFDFLVFWQADKSLQAQAETLGARVYLIEKPTLRTMFKYAKQVDLFFAEHKGEYDAVHCHEFLVQSIVLPIAKKYGIGVRLVHSHNNNYDGGFVKNLRNMFLKIGYKRNATTFLACSKEAAEALFSKRIASKTVILPNAIDMSIYSYDKTIDIKLRNQYSIEASDFVIGNVGRLAYQKNQNFLIEIFEKILKTKKAKLILVGDGVDKEKLLNTVKEKNLQDNIIFTGNICNVNEIFNCFDIFVFPSRFEGLGIVLIEAQANGLKCIASDRVPIESKMSDNIEYLPLENGVSAWVNAILSADTERKDNSGIIARNGYDVKANQELLLSIYRGERKTGEL